MRKKITWFVILVASHLLFFLAGSTTGRYVTLKYFAHETEKANASVSAGHYVVYRDIAVDIKARKYDEAKCKAELIASSLLDEAKSCMAAAECRDSIEIDVRAKIPEVLGNTPLPFDYLEAKNGVRRCMDRAAN